MASERGWCAIRKLVLTALAVVALGAVFFALTWEVPAPTRQVEVVIPDEKLPQ